MKTKNWDDFLKLHFTEEQLKDAVFRMQLNLIRIEEKEEILRRFNELKKEF